MTWVGAWRRVVARVPAGVKWRSVRLRVPGDAVGPENVDHALIDRLVHGLFGRSDAQKRDQGPPGAAMGADHRVARKRRVPSPDPQRHLPGVLAARRHEL